MTDNPGATHEVADLPASKSPDYLSTYCNHVEVNRSDRDAFFQFSEVVYEGGELSVLHKARIVVPSNQLEGLMRAMAQSLGFTVVAPDQGQEGGEGG